MRISPHMGTHPVLHNTNLMERPITKAYTPHAQTTWPHARAAAYLLRKEGVVRPGVRVADAPRAEAELADRDNVELPPPPALPAFVDPPPAAWRPTTEGVRAKEVGAGVTVVAVAGGASRKEEDTLPEASMPTPPASNEAWGYVSVRCDGKRMSASAAGPVVVRLAARSADNRPTHSEKVMRLWPKGSTVASMCATSSSDLYGAMVVIIICSCAGDTMPEADISFSRNRRRNLDKNLQWGRGMKRPGRAQM